MASYYNEIDPFCARWLRELIADGLIAPGDVDERDIREVTPDDVRGYTQCHFFAGIGGWSYALRLAGWDDARPVWSGSCPCQPFSVAGKGKGSADERHLWPQFFRLIRECRPAIIFGEQVKGAIRHGWLDGISADLEAARYAVGAHVLGAHSVCAPHIRQRLYWVGVANSTGRQQRQQRATSAGHWNTFVATGCVDRVADAECGAAERQRFDLAATARTIEADSQERKRLRPDIGASGNTFGMADTNCGAGVQGSSLARGRNPRGNAQPWSGFGGHGDDCRMGHADSPEATRQQQICISMEPEQKADRSSNADVWSRAKFIGCADGKARRIEPGIQPLAHGFPNRVGTLRGAGNAICPQIAAEFIKACNL